MILKLIVAIFLSTTFCAYGQIECSEITDSLYCGNCVRLDRQGNVSSSRKIWKGKLFERTDFSLLGDTTHYERIDTTGELSFVERYYRYGNLILEIEVIKGSGKFTSYYPNGNLEYVGLIKDSCCVAPWSLFSQNGDLLIQLDSIAVMSKTNKSITSLNVSCGDNQNFLRHMRNYVNASARATPWIITDRKIAKKEKYEYRDNHR